jgi:hypothetical protein
MPGRYIYREIGGGRESERARKSKQERARAELFDSIQDPAAGTLAK